MTEALLFWLLASLAVLGGMAVLVLRKAVHVALALAVVMVCLAGLYLGVGAVFLGVVQIVVYAGAIMMLFLFVLMLVGVDAAESTVEPLRGHRVVAMVASTALLLLVIAELGGVASPAAGRSRPPSQDGDVRGLVELIFGRYVLAFEVTSVLLITAALGAMLLAHRENGRQRPGQRELSERRIKALTSGGPVHGRSFSDPAGMR